MAETPINDPENDPKKYKPYVSSKHGEFTTVDDHMSITANMPVKKYDAIAAALDADPRASSVVERMSDAMAHAKKDGEKYDHAAFMAKQRPEEREALYKLMNTLQAETGNTDIQNVTAVSKDKHLPLAQQGGRQRMIDVAGHHALPTAESVSKVRAMSTPILYRAGKVIEKAAQFAHAIPGLNKVATAASLTAAGAAMAKAHTPEEKRIARGELVREFAAVADPTGLIGPSIVHQALGLPGKNPLREAISNEEKVNDTGRINLTNQKIDREQNFLMSPDHPDQLSALKVKDPKTGQHMDVAAALKNPEQRAVILADLTIRQAAATTPEGREQLGHMREAAVQYAQLESQRREGKADAVAKVGTPDNEHRLAAATIAPA